MATIWHASHPYKYYNVNHWKLIMYESVDKVSIDIVIDNTEINKWGWTILWTDNTCLHTPGILTWPDNTCLHTPGILTWPDNTCLHTPGILTLPDNTCLHTPGILTWSDNTCLHTPGILTWPDNTCLHTCDSDMTW